MWLEMSKHWVCILALSALRWSRAWALSPTPSILSQGENLHHEPVLAFKLHLPITGRQLADMHTLYGQLCFMLSSDIQERIVPSTPIVPGYWESSSLGESYRSLGTWFMNELLSVVMSKLEFISGSSWRKGSWSTRLWHSLLDGRHCLSTLLAPQGKYIRKQFMKKAWKSVHVLSLFWR
jgi:hypothetical protein